MRKGVKLFCCAKLRKLFNVAAQQYSHRNNCSKAIPASPLLLRRRITVISAIPVLLILVCVSFFRQQYVAPILMYHSLSPEARKENRLSVSVKTFERQMRFLKERKYNVLPLEELAALIRDNKKIPAHTVAITFDDGYKNNYTYALPILKKYNLAATIFIITDEVGRQQNDRLSWEEIKIMKDSGLIFIGSHALGPEPFINIKSESEIRRQVFESKKILEEKLGCSVAVFSYPEGRFNAKITQLVKDAGYQFAVATNPGKKIRNKDIYALKRLRVSENTGNLFTFWIQTSGFYNFIRENRKK